jgi:hypothetical protein
MLLFPVLYKQFLAAGARTSALAGRRTIRALLPRGRQIMKAAAEGHAGQRPSTADRVTVALVPKAADDLQHTIERTGLSKTDVINRAVSLYEFIDSRLSDGAELLIRDGKTGQIERIRFF